MHDAADADDVPTIYTDCLDIQRMNSSVGQHVLWSGRRSRGAAAARCLFVSLTQIAAYCSRSWPRAAKYFCILYSRLVGFVPVLVDVLRCPKHIIPLQLCQLVWDFSSPVPALQFPARPLAVLWCILSAHLVGLCPILLGRPSLHCPTFRRYDPQP